MDKKIKFEDAIKELEEIVKKLENGDESLENSLSLFEKGIKLTKYCQNILENAEQKVTIITKDKETGKPIEQPFEVDENEA